MSLVSVLSPQPQSVNQHLWKRRSRPLLEEGPTGAAYQALISCALTNFVTLGKLSQEKMAAYAHTRLRLYITRSDDLPRSIASTRSSLPLVWWL